MAEDKRQAMLRFAKRGTALLTAIVMTVEQVPLSDALPVRALADEITDAPGLVGRMAMEGGTGVTVENGLISMSKKMTAKGYLHIEGGRSDDLYYDVNVHIDTPTIFRDKATEEVIVDYVGMFDGLPIDPEAYAEKNGWEILGGVEVGFPNLNGWDVWRPSKGDKILETRLDALYEQENPQAPSGGGSGSGSVGQETVDPNGGQGEAGENEGQEEDGNGAGENEGQDQDCLLYTSDAADE